VEIASLVGKIANILKGELCSNFAGNFYNVL
jgi:hypothetical protein